MVRRLTGGRAIYHHLELTYSFSASILDGPFSKGLLDSYRKISGALCRAMSKLGLRPEAKDGRDGGRGHRDSRSPLCFDSASFAEITLGNRKIIGSAQKRWKDSLMQQGSIPYSFDEDTVKKVFNMDPEVNLGEKMIGLGDVIPGLEPADLKGAIRVSFEETFETEFIPTSLFPEEHLLALQSEAQRYLSPEWTQQR